MASAVVLCFRQPFISNEGVFVPHCTLAKGSRKEGSSGEIAKRELVITTLTRVQKHDRHGAQPTRAPRPPPCAVPHASLARQSTPMRSPFSVHNDNVSIESPMCMKLHPFPPPTPEDADEPPPPPPPPATVTDETTSDSVEV